VAKRHSGMAFPGTQKLCHGKWLRPDVSWRTGRCAFLGWGAHLLAQLGVERQLRLEVRRWMGQ